MLEAIYSSKLYRNSKNKEKIRAAINNPMNTELVQQLSKYIDDVEYYEDPDNIVKEDTASSDFVEDKKDKSTENNSDNSDSSDIKHTSNETIKHSAPITSEDPKDDNLVDSLDTSGKDIEIENEFVEPETKEVESATDINDIKTLLNDTDNICGVNRTQKKDKEFWIYYNDNVNLNNIMGDVIEFCCNINSDLQFNRLARSENAIVFETVDNVL